MLNRGNYLLLAPMFALWLFWRGSGAGMRRALLMTILYTAGAIAAIAPVSVRNLVLGGEFVLITSQGGQNFYIGNNPQNDTGSYVVTDEIRPNPLFEEADFLAMARRETGRELSPTEASRYFFAKGWRWITENPGDAVSLFLRKWGLWFAGIEVADNYDFGFIRDHYAWTLRLPISNAYAYGTLGWSGLLLGLIFWRRPTSLLSPRANPDLMILTGFVWLYSLSITLFYVFGRYRVPIHPALIILSIGTVDWLFEEWRTMSKVKRGVMLMPILLATFFCFRPFFQPGRASFLRHDSIALFNIGTIHLKNGDAKKALETFRLAQTVAINEGNELALSSIGLIYWRNFGKIDEARVIFKKVSAQNSDNYSAWYYLGVLAASQNNFLEAERALEKARKLRPDLSIVSLNLADVNLATGNKDLARRHFADYVEKQKKNPEEEALKGMGKAAKFLLESPYVEEFEIGLEALALIPESDPNNPPWLFSLTRLRTTPEKEEALRRFLKAYLGQQKLSPEAQSQIVARLAKRQTF
jgi:tetratricopeptide (TPR) repeat protein